MKNAHGMKNNTQGFTLIELLIVIAIIGILAAVLIPNLVGARNKANETATQSYIRNCFTAVETERDSVSQALPGAANCADTKLNNSVVTLPAGSVKANGTITQAPAGDKFSVSAESVNGTKYCFDGTSMNKGKVSAAGICGAGV